MSDLAAPFAFELARRAPSQRTAGLISGMTGYRETVRGRFFQREAAGLVVPLIISFGTPFLIALSREPDAADRQPSFAAGLHAGPVFIESDGGAECVQVDFTPLGAYRFFGGTVVDLAARMVDMSTCWAAKAGRCANGSGLHPAGRTASIWSRILSPVAPTICPRPRSNSPIAGWRAAAGGARITALAGEIGWSRKHLVDRFRSELGLAPKPIARMMRFHHACRLARGGARIGWAGIAAESGYADQAHLAREFSTLAGETPTAWARRLALTPYRPRRTISR